MTEILSARKWTQRKQNSQFCRGDSRKIRHQYDHMCVHQCQGEIYTDWAWCECCGSADLSHALYTGKDRSVKNKPRKIFHHDQKMKSEHTEQIPIVNK